MADIATLIKDVSKFKDDTLAAIKRAQDSIDKLQVALSNATLTPEQQAALDAVDAAVNTADTTVQAFDVPPTPPVTPVTSAPVKPTT